MKCVSSTVKYVKINIYVNIRSFRLHMIALYDVYSRRTHTTYTQEVNSAHNMHVKTHSRRNFTINTKRAI